MQFTAKGHCSPWALVCHVLSYCCDVFVLILSYFCHVFVVFLQDCVQLQLERGHFPVVCVISLVPQTLLHGKHHWSQTSHLRLQLSLVWYVWILRVSKSFSLFGGHPWCSGSALTAGQRVERWILHQVHDSQQNSAHLPRLSTAQCSLIVQNLGLKHQSFHLVLSSHLTSGMVSVTVDVGVIKCF